MLPQIIKRFPRKFYFVLNKTAHFKTAQMNLQRKNVNRRKNNFLYKDEFKDYRESNEVSHENKKSSPTLLSIEKGSVPSVVKKKNNLSPLQYKGEIIFGIHPVYLALLKQKRNIFQLFLRTDQETVNGNGNLLRKNEIEKMAKATGISVCKIDSKGMKYLASGAVHQGVCLDAGPLPLPEWQENKRHNLDLTHIPLWLVLDEILDPMNVGAVIRSAHYFGVNKLFVSRSKSCKLSPVVSKASSGVLEIMDIHQIERLEDFIQARKNDGWEIISTVTYCEDSKEILGPVVDVADIKVLKPTVLILGNEGRGISTEIQKLCDSFVSIYPKQDLHHGIDSLNVSVAAGVILYALSCLKSRHLKNS